MVLKVHPAQLAHGNSQRPLPELKVLLRYENRLVVNAFASKYGISIREAKTIFKDAIRYLWLGERLRSVARSRSSSRSEVHNPMYGYWLVIDEMWHCFILHSEDYHRFCMRFFGRPIWHVPGTQKRKKESLSIGRRAMDRNLRATMNLLYDLFGPKVLNRWFGTYPKKYTPMSLCKMQIKALS